MTTTYRRKITRAVFPVAGLGTRLLPVTKSVPKEMLTLVDRPLIDYAVREALEAGIEDLIFVTARGKSALTDYFDDAPLLEAALETAGKWDLRKELRGINGGIGKIAYVRQAQALGLGHALLCAKKLLPDNEPFAVLLPDDVIRAPIGALSQMIEAYQDVGGCIIAATEVARTDVTDYGIIDPGERVGAVTRVRGLIEKPKVHEAPSNLAIVGRYILQPEVLSNIQDRRSIIHREIELTNAIAQEIAKGRDVFAFEFEGKRFDCGSKLGLAQANVALALERPDLRENMSDFLKQHLASEIDEVD